MTTPEFADKLFSHSELHLSREERQTGQFTSGRFRAAALSLHTHGYVILKGAISERLIQQTATEFESVLLDCQRSREGESWYQTSDEHDAVFWERNARWRIFPKLRGVFSDPKILANSFAMQLLRFFLGDDLYCKFVSSDTCLKGAELQSPHRELGAGESWVPNSYVVNIPLCHCTLDNGPLEVWPGTGHLWRNELLDELNFSTENQDEENPEISVFADSFPSRKLTFEVGDVLIRDPGLLHRGTVNSTETPRSMLTLCYFRDGNDYDYGKWEYSLDEQTYQELSADVKPLFPQAARRFGSLAVSKTASDDDSAVPVASSPKKWRKVLTRLFS